MPACCVLRCGESTAETMETERAPQIKAPPAIKVQTGVPGRQSAGQERSAIPPSTFLTFRRMVGIPGT
jgi:hypothetical protein